jgi:hypothetical protein
MLADALVAMRRSGMDLDLAAFDERMRELVRDAEVELAIVPAEDRVLQMETAVIGTVGVEVAFGAMRRLALEHASWRRFGRGRRQ